MSSTSSWSRCRSSSTSSRASTTCSIATARGRRSASTSPTITTCTRSTPRSSRRRRSGSESPCSEFGMEPGEGLCTDMRAVRKDYFLDHDHSVYVDQWDWEKVITEDQRNLGDAEGRRSGDLAGPARRRGGSPRAVPAAPRRALPRPARGDHLHARRGPARRATPTCRASSVRRGSSRSIPAVFIIGIGWTLAGRLPARDAGGRLRRLGHADDVDRRTADARPERRHPRLEPGHPAPPRADVDGHPRERRDAPPAARADGPARLAQAAVPPRHRRRRRCR